LRKGEEATGQSSGTIAEAPALLMAAMSFDLFMTEKLDA